MSRRLEDGTAQRKEALTVIVKTTYQCNFRCSYCYEDDRRSLEGGMDEKVLYNVIRNVLSSVRPQGSVLFIWHGGEPLLMGLEYYEKVVSYQQELGGDVYIRNSIQTNGSLMTYDMADFFSKCRFGVGFSLDGPRELNDANRSIREGSSAYEAILKGLNTYNTVEHNRFGILSIMTRATLENLDSYYEFVRTNSFNTRINPLYLEGAAARSKDTLSISPEEYGRSMAYLFDRWFYDKTVTFRISPLDELLAGLLGYSPCGCIFEDKCFTNYLHISPTGDVYPCGLQGLVYGNVNRVSLDEVLRSPLIPALEYKRRRAQEACHGCSHYPLCHSGCSRRAFMRRRSFADRDYYCAGYRMLLDHMSEALKTEFGVRSLNEVPTTMADDIQNSALKLVLRDYHNRGGTWMDKQWMQWRGDWREAWFGDHSEAWPCAAGDPGNVRA